METFLIRRAFCDRIGGMCSAKLDIAAGVLKGSALGPLLFLLLVIELASALKSPGFIFPDDITLVGSTVRESLSNGTGLP